MSFPPGGQGPPPPPGYGAPAPTPAPPRPGRTVLVLALAAVLVVAALVAVAGVVLVARGSDDLSGGDASASLGTFVDEADFDAEDFPALAECPFGDLDAVLEGVDAEVGAIPDLPDRTQNAFPAVDGTEAGVACFAQDEDEDEDEDEGGSGLVVVAATFAPDGDYEELLEAVYPEQGVTVEGSSSFRGGEVVTYCYEPAEGPGGCGADWLAEEDDVVISLSGTDVDLGPAAASVVLRDLLPDLVDSLSEAEPRFE